MPDQRHDRIVRLLADELLRRSPAIDPDFRQTSTDAELWVAPDDWVQALDQVNEVLSQLHRVALPPRSPGAAHVSVSLAMFAMTDLPDDEPTR